MAMHQYIGARYVPIYYQNSLDPTSTEWEPNVTYEPLTIVTLPNLHSYISKKTVPDTIGSPALNAEYWLDTGSDNAYIQDLQDQVDAITAELADMNSRNHILLFGDSWADVEHDPSNSRIELVLNNQFPYCTVHNYSYGGTAFEGTNGFDEQLDAMDLDATVDKKRIKCVILVGGLNERALGTNESAFITKMTTWYNKLIGIINDTNVPVYFFHNYSMENSATGTHTTTYYYQFNYYEVIRKSLQIPVIMPFTMGWLRYDHWNNDFHPNASGSIEFALNMVMTINGANTIYYEYGRYEAVWNGSDAVAWRTISVSFFVDRNHHLKAVLKTPRTGLTLLATGSGGTDATFNHAIPVPIPALTVLESGVAIQSGDYSKINLRVFNTTAHNDGWTTSMSGFYTKTIESL